MPDMNLEDVLPLLMSRQKQQQAENASKAVGNFISPSLTSILSGSPRPTPAPPIPNAAGKIPPQDGMDPRFVPALRDIGAMGAGGAVGRALAPAMGAAGEMAGRALPEATEAGANAARAIGGGMALTPPDPAEAATRLTPEQKQQIEIERQRQGIQNQGKAAEISATSEAQAKADVLKAQTQREIDEQNRVAAALRAKQDREQPFREAHSDIAKWMPAVGMGLSAAIPYGRGFLNRGKLQDFANNWTNAGNAAAAAIPGKAKTPATLAVNRLKDFERDWPAMEKRYTPGLGQTSLMGSIPAEAAAFPTEYDAMTQDPSSPSKPGTNEWIDAGRRAGIAGVGGALMGKLGANMRTPVRPFTGGPGIIETYNRKYPTRRK